MKTGQLMRKLEFYATPKGRLVLSVLLAFPSAIVTGLCLHWFWLSQARFKLLIITGLVLAFSLVYYLLLAKVSPISERRNITLLNLLFLLLAIIAPVGLLFGTIKSQLLILMPTRVDLQLSSQSTEPAQLKIVIASLETEKRSFSPARYSPDCELQPGFILVAAEKSCQITYLVTSYEADRLEIEFDPLQSVGVVEVSTPIGGNRYLFEGGSGAEEAERFSVALNWVQQRIKVPVFTLLGFSLFSVFILLGLAFRTMFSAPLARKGSRKSVSQYWVFLLFGLIALIYANARFGAGFRQTIVLPSDAGNIASYLAAADHPDNFRVDELLSNPENYSVYFTAFLPLISMIARLTGSYASAFMTLLAPVILLQLVGYYLLGKKLLKNRLLAFCFALVTAIPISLPLLEYFGLSSDILPRTLFQAMLPYGLLLLLSIENQPKWYWLVSLVFTIMLNFHPVSGPAWVGICLLTLLIFSVRELRKNWWRAFLPALFVFLVGVIPFLLAYIRPVSHVDVDPLVIAGINLSRYSSQTKPIVELYASDMWNFLRGKWSLIALSLAMLGFVLWTIVGLRERNNYKKVINPGYGFSGLLLLWWVVLVFVSVVVPLLDEAIATAFDRGLMLREIRRTMRYFIPMLWLTFFWLCQRALTVFENSRQPGKSLLMVWAAVVCLMICYGVETQIWKNPIFVKQAECLRAGSLICRPDPEKLALHEFYSELTKHVQPNESVFPDPDPRYLSDTLIPRYHSLRSVVYTYKDGGAIGAFLQDWWRITQGVKPYLPTSERGLHPSVVEVARTSGADYFYFIHPDKMALEYLKNQEVVFQNDYGVLISLK